MWFIVFVICFVCGSFVNWVVICYMIWLCNVRLMLLLILVWMFLFMLWIVSCRKSWIVFELLWVMWLIVVFVMFWWFLNWCIVVVLMMFLLFGVICWDSLKRSWSFVLILKINLLLLIVLRFCFVIYFYLCMVGGSLNFLLMSVWICVNILRMEDLFLLIWFVWVKFLLFFFVMKWD